jgi:hypothetical protein
MPKELRAIVRQIEARGFSVARDTGRYYKVRNADGAVVFALPATPGRGRWLQNLRSELRRRGIID